MNSYYMALLRLLTVGIKGPDARGLLKEFRKTTEASRLHVNVCYDSSGAASHGSGGALRVDKYCGFSRLPSMSLTATIITLEARAWIQPLGAYHTPFLHSSESTG